MINKQFVTTFVRRLVTQLLQFYFFKIENVLIIKTVINHERYMSCNAQENFYIINGIKRVWH